MREMKQGSLYEIVSDRYTGSIVIKPVAIDYVIQVYSPNGELSGFRPSSQTYHRVKPYNGTVTLKNENEND